MREMRGKSDGNNTNAGKQSTIVCLWNNATVIIARTCPVLRCCFSWNSVSRHDIQLSYPRGFP